MDKPTSEVLIDYSNPRGVRRIRRIRPIRMVFESNKYHSECQWIIYAVDIEKSELRGFTMADIHSWRPAPPTL